MNDEFYTSVDRFSNHILYRGYAADGEPILKKVKFRPKLFIPSKDEDKERVWHTMSGEPVKMMKFDSMREMKSFQEMYEGVESFKYYGFERHQIAFIQSKFPGEIKYDARQVNVVNFDIETEVGEGFPNPSTALREVRAITAHCSRDNKYYIWGLKSNYTPRSSRYVYKCCVNEDALLESFIDWWTQPYYTPDVLTGWNIETFDIPYLFNRIINRLGEDYAKKLSPWGLISKRQIKSFGRVQDAFDITGIQVLDYIDLFKKFAVLTYGNQESYSLGHIAHVVLDEAKLDYSDAGNLDDLYNTDFQRYIDYNIHDVEIVQGINDKLAYIDIVMTLAYMAGVNYSDTLKTTPVWDAIIFRRLSRQNIVVPINRNHLKTSFAGGYVKEPQVGIHDWVMSFDLNSLYPNIIVQHNMSPEKLLSGIDTSVSMEDMIAGKFVNTTPMTAVAANGVRFSTDGVGVIAGIVREIYAARVTIKAQMLEAQRECEQIDPKGEREKYQAVSSQIARLKNKQVAIKTALNSLYGAMGNAYFRYFDLKIAEAVTLTGQVVIQYAERVVNAALDEAIGTSKDRVIAIDTDSVYVGMSDAVNKWAPKKPVDFLDKFGTQFIEPKLEAAFAGLATRHGSIEPRLQMAREVIADRGIWTAKKRYVLNVLDNEGVRFAKPKIKIMGIEAIKSSTPEACRNEMKRMFPVILTTNEATVQAQIAAYKEKFFALPVNQIASPRSATSVRKYVTEDTYTKGTPIHVRGAILYNSLLKAKGLTNKYRGLYDGDKLKYVYLKTPNPINENVISFPDDHLPVEFGLHSFVDYDLQFMKAFADPLQSVLTAIGWNHEAKASLESFFG